MRCLNCNKNDAIKYSKYSSGKFCSKRCACQYSSLIKRDEINKKLSIKNKHKRYVNGVLINTKFKNNLKIKNKVIKRCKSCFDELKISINKKYCDDCFHFSRNRKMFLKLGVLDNNLKICNEKALNKLKELYFEQKQSLTDIYNIFKIRENTLFWFFKKNSIPCRTFKQSALNALSVGKGNIKRVPHNGSTYKNGWHTTWNGKKYFLRSSYEKKFADFLDDKKIYYEVNTKRIPYIYKNENHTYIADFYIPELMMIVETKCGYFYKKDKLEIDAKLKSCSEHGYKILLLVDSQIDEYIKKN